MPLHIRARKDDIAPLVVAVGNPGRARDLAKLLEKPRLVNDYRSLLVYTGFWKGKPITIATHGVGAGSAGIVFEELNELGAKVIVRLGTAGAIINVKPGSIVVADSSLSAEGGCGSNLYTPGLNPPLAPDPFLTVSLYKQLVKTGFNPVIGPVFCSDAFYAETRELGEKLARIRVVAIEMEAATLFLVSKIRGFKAGAVLVISNRIASKDFLDPDRVESLMLKVAPAIFDVLINYS